MTLRSLIAAVASVLLLFGAWTSAYAQEPKSLNGVALIIGQSDYRNIDALPNPANDARDMSKLLTDLGFDARTVTDRDAAKLRRDLERFEEDAEGADVALIYYSGHGIEAGGENWLVPVDADLSSLEDAGERLVSISSVIDRLKAKVPVTIVLLDACRTNPFPPGAMVKASPDAEPAPVGAAGLTLVRGMKMFGGGQKPGPANDNLGIVIGFAAEPGEPALDGAAGSNSPYASALMRHLTALKGVEFGQVMRMVTEEVYLATGTKQRPWTNESLRRLLYFGIAPEEPAGPEGKINGERRQLLLTMADLPSAERVQVEQVALREGVKLDALYGVLRAMGTEVIPKDPAQLETLLQGQAVRLREMTQQREALRTDDPQIVQLALAADRAIGEGAIVSAREFLDLAVARIEKNAGTVDMLAQQVKDKQLADAAIYARRADASALTFAFAAAATDYAKAFDLVEKWDDKLAWNYKNQQAEALRGQGGAHGDREAYEKSVEAYQALLNMLPNGEKSEAWAWGNFRKAEAIYASGYVEFGTEKWLRALPMLEESAAILAGSADRTKWADVQLAIGELLASLGARTGDPDKLRQGLDALNKVSAAISRDGNPRQWVQLQRSLGWVDGALAEAFGNADGLERARNALLAALTVSTREGDPIGWSLINIDLGSTLMKLGRARNNRAHYVSAVDAYSNALTVLDRNAWPQPWGSAQLGLGAVYLNLAAFKNGQEFLDKANESFTFARQIFERDKATPQWAATQTSLAVLPQELGRRASDVSLLKQSLATIEETRKLYGVAENPMAFAMTELNAGNTLHMIALVTDDAASDIEAAKAYRNALSVYSFERNPLYWAQANLALGRVLATQASSDDDHSAQNTEAVAALLNALTVLTKDNTPIDWAIAQSTLGAVLVNFSSQTGSSGLLAEAGIAFEASLQVYTVEAEPTMWAFIQNNIGDVHATLAFQGGAKAESDKAIAKYIEARQMFVTLDVPRAVELLNKKIDLMQDTFR